MCSNRYQETFKYIPERPFTTMVISDPSCKRHMHVLVCIQTIKHPAIAPGASDDAPATLSQ